jgi:WD40 repeat protein
VTCLSFSSDGSLLASRSYDDTIRLWRCDTWDGVALLEEPGKYWPSGLAFHPEAPMLAAVDEENMAIHIWDLDLSALMGAASPARDATPAGRRQAAVSSRQ